MPVARGKSAKSGKTSKAAPSGKPAKRAPAGAAATAPPAGAGAGAAARATAAAGGKSVAGGKPKAAANDILPDLSHYTECILDTAVWRAVFEDRPAADHFSRIRGDLKVVITPVVLAELTALAREGKDRDDTPVDVIEEVARVEPMTREDALFGGRLFAALSTTRTGLGLGDCLVYATAQRIGALTVTIEKGLGGQPGVVVLPTR